MQTFLLKHRRILIALALILASTIPFWLWPIDNTLISYFYRPGAINPWPVEQFALWQFFYKAAPFITLFLGGSAIFFIVAGTLRFGWRRWRMWGLFIFLTLALGPGLLVNALGKDHAGRPRPRQTIAFGGTEAYRPPLYIAPGEGKSFPCGHCSIGFATGVFALMCFPRRPRLGVAVLGVSLILGLAMGVGRMAAGAHYFSDILWAGIMVWGVILFLYYPGLRIYDRITQPEHFPSLQGRTVLTQMATAVGLGLLVCGALLAMPFQQKISDTFDTSAHSLVITAPAVSLTVVYVDQGPALAWQGSFTGFGFPGRKVKVNTHAKSDDPTRAHVKFYKRGFFTELEGSLTVFVNAAQVNYLKLDLPPTATLIQRDETDVTRPPVMDIAQ